MDHCRRITRTNVAVTPEQRGKGLSSRLMETLFEFAIDHKFASMTLEVRTTNSVAIKLYEKFGFKQIGINQERTFFAISPK